MERFHQNNGWRKLISIASAVLVAAMALPAASTWDLNSNGKWNKASNWTPTGIPNSVGASAVLGNTITSNRTITLGQNITIGHLTINDNNNYTITGNTLTFDVSSGNASLDISNSGSPTISSAVTFNDNLNISQNGTGTFTISGDITGNNSKVLTIGGSGDTVISGIVDTAGNIVKTGDGTTTIKGSNDNTAHDVTVSGGTLTLQKNSGKDAIGPSGTVTVNSGGTLLLAANNQINDNVNMVLNGGTFSTGATTGHDETLGVLTLTANSVINLGTGKNNDLFFADSSSNAWTGNLTISGWTGTSGITGGSTQGSIFFDLADCGSGLTSTQLQSITFEGFGQGSLLLSTGELVPVAAVPEAQVVLGLILLTGFIGWRERRHLEHGFTRFLRSRVSVK